MYKISTPFMIHERASKEEILAAASKMGTQRIFLAIDRYFDSSLQQKSLQRLSEFIPFFKQRGFEVGVWFWTFWRSDPQNAPKDVYPITGFDGSTHNHFCPSSKHFAEMSADFMKQVASLSPHIIMFDDDYRFGFLPTGYGCCCPNHLKLLSEAVGEPVERTGLEKKLFSGGANKYRSAYLKSLGDCLKSFAVQMRKAVDSVDPTIRIALCSCMSLWDCDGVDSATIAKLLAGNTKPLLRFIGAPYWAALDRAFGCRLQHVIETERMESAWCKKLGVELETMTEGDTYPRPRHITPTSYLEGFDLATRISGVADGILKYTYDYTSSLDYESGYVAHHKKNVTLYQKSEEYFKGKQIKGIYIYEALNKLENAQFPTEGVSNSYVQNMFFSISAKVMSDNSLPTTYTDTSSVCAVFGQNADSFPTELMSKGVFLDITAAKLLAKRGIDVGIESFGEPYTPELLYYPQQNQYTGCRAESDTQYYFTPKQGAEVLTYGVNKDKKSPECIFYTNKAGQKFIVFGFDSSRCGERRWRNYCMQQLLFDGVKRLCAKPLIAECKGNPDLYVVCGQNNNETAIGLFNFFADSIISPVITLDKTYKNAEFAGCNGTLSGNTVTLSEIPAYGFGFIRLR